MEKRERCTNSETQVWFGCTAGGGGNSDGGAESGKSTWVEKEDKGISQLETAMDPFVVDELGALISLTAPRILNLKKVIPSRR